MCMHVLLATKNYVYAYSTCYTIQLHRSKQKNRGNVSKRHSCVKNKQDNDATAQLETEVQSNEEEGGGEGSNDDSDIVFVEECEEGKEVDEVNKREEERELDEVNKVEEGEEEENTGSGEVASTNLPQVPDIDYLTDLTELQNRWKSTNTQTLGELWYHLFKYVSVFALY